MPLENTGANDAVTEYPVSPVVDRWLEQQYMHHAPSVAGNEAARYALVRTGCLELAKLIHSICPESDELGTANDRLNEVMFWSNAAIARHPMAQTPQSRSEL